ncbi:hypothetical protein AB1L88_04520 [Tautonia sp. JC769]|uniref:cell division protein FtsQ/DivIB n=1 Tax=Tautonia sp. JC769 TaxID=3232135 RepID=UPI003459DFDE
MLRLATDADEHTPPPAADRAAWLSLMVGVLGPRGTHAALVAVAVLGLSLLVVSGLPGRVRAWVHDRPEYDWAIAQISLDPEPPSWLRSGKRGVLSAVAEPLRAFDQGSVLDLDLGAVERAFKNVYWVERVRGIQRSYPNGVSVAVDYRRPVAIAPIDPPDAAGHPAGRDYLVIDRTGLILDRVPVNSDSGRTFSTELVVLSGLSVPQTITIGQPWPRPDPSDQLVQSDRAAEAAARLARFLLDQADRDGWPETRSGQTIPFRRIHPFQGDPRKLYIYHQFADGRVLWVVWDAAPGAEGSGEPTAIEKWEMLRNWISSGGIDRPLDQGALGFTTRGPVWLPPI